MSYVPGIPAANDVPSSSQGQIQTNFTQLNTIFDVDHVTFDAAIDNGEHNRITFNSPIADPNAADPKATLYTKTIAGDSQLFFENFDVGGAVNVVRQMTDLVITNLVNAGTAGGSLYRIDFPIGVTVYCGATNNFSGNRTVTFPVSYTTIYTSQLTAIDVNVQKTSIQQNINGLTIYTENGVQVNWMAIGTI